MVGVVRVYRILVCLYSPCVQLLALRSLRSAVVGQRYPRTDARHESGESLKISHTCVTAVPLGAQFEREVLLEIALAVKMVASGKEYFCTEALNVMKANVNASKIASGLLDSPDRTTRLFASYKKLSPKEKEIFEFLAQGFSVSEIAQKLGKSIKTVENQRTAVYEKMELHGMGDLAEGARMLGYY